MTDDKKKMNGESMESMRMKKKAMLIISGILLVILAVGIIVYNLRLSRIDEDIYFTVYHYAKEGEYEYPVLL